MFFNINHRQDFRVTRCFRGKQCPSLWRGDNKFKIKWQTLLSATLLYNIGSIYLSQTFK